MTDVHQLSTAIELARRGKMRLPNENSACRGAPAALPVEKIEMRRHVERVAGQRRALAHGGEVTGN